MGIGRNITNTREFIFSYDCRQKSDELFVWKSWLLSSYISVNVCSVLTEMRNVSQNIDPKQNISIIYKFWCLTIRRLFWFADKSCHKSQIQEIHFAVCYDNNISIVFCLTYCNWNLFPCFLWQTIRLKQQKQSDALHSPRLTNSRALHKRQTNKHPI